MELRYWWELGNEKNKNKLVERKAFVDCVEIKSADLENEILLFKVLRISVLKRNTRLSCPCDSTC